MGTSSLPSKCPKDRRKLIIVLSCTAIVCIVINIHYVRLEAVARGEPRCEQDKKSSVSTMSLLSKSSVESAVPQTRKVRSSWSIKEELEILSKAVKGLEAEIDGQAALLSNLESKANVQQSLVASLNANKVLQINSLGNLEAESKLQKNLLDKLESSAATQTNFMTNLEAKVEMQSTLLTSLRTHFNEQTVLLNKMVANLETHEFSMNKLVAEQVWQQPVPQHETNRTIVALVGDDVEIWCVAHGKPLPEITWNSENRILASDRLVIENNGKALRIKNVQPSDEATYACLAANGVGTPASQYVSLEVYGQAKQCHRIIESDTESLQIEPSNSSCLWVIKLQKTTGIRLQLDPHMMEPIQVIPEQSYTDSNIETHRIKGSNSVRHEFEGKSLAILAPPRRERTTLNWTGLAVDDSGVFSSEEFQNDSGGRLEWEHTGEGTGKIFLAVDLKSTGALYWILQTALSAWDQATTCENISLSALQIGPYGNISDVQKTCDGFSKGSLKWEISSQVLVLLHIQFLDAARSKLLVSWAQPDEPVKKSFDGVVAGSYRNSAILIPFNSEQTKTIALGRVNGLEFDWNSRKIYYLKQFNAIVRSNLDGTESEIVLSDSSSSLVGVEVEPITGNLYYCNSTSRSIQACNFHSSKCSTIAKIGDLSPVFHFAVHQSKGILFWSIWDKKVVRANLDGSNATVLLERKVFRLDVDEYEDRLYWCSREGIGSCDLNGQDLRMLPNLNAVVTDVAIDGDKVYYANIDTKSIHVISKTGTNSRLIAKLRIRPSSIALYGMRVSNPPWNPCEESKCAHLCVLITRWSYRCTCPDNMELNADGKTCKP